MENNPINGDMARGDWGGGQMQRYAARCKRVISAWFEIYTQYGLGQLSVGVGICTRCCVELHVWFELYTLFFRVIRCLA